MNMQKYFPQPHPFVNRGEQGIVIMLGILILGAVGIAISVASILSGINQSLTSGVEIESAQARALANACAEVALNKLRLQPSYAGNETIAIDNDVCQIRPVLNSGTSTPTIQTQATKRSSTKRVQIIISARNPRIQLGSWTEVADY